MRSMGKCSANPIIMQKKQYILSFLSNFDQSLNNFRGFFTKIFITKECTEKKNIWQAICDKNIIIQWQD
jgi:hypothetical protein